MNKLFGGNASNLVQLAQKRTPGNIANQRAFLDDIAKKFNITNQEGWYKISGKILKQHGGHDLLRDYNFSPLKLLKTVYPEYLFNNISSFIVSYIPNGINLDLSYH